jgi:hypothetical protein
MSERQAITFASVSQPATERAAFAPSDHYLGPRCGCSSQRSRFASFREEKTISIVSLCQEQLMERVNISLAEFGSPPLPVLKKGKRVPDTISGLTS